MFPPTPPSWLEFIYLFLERGEGRDKEGEKHSSFASRSVNSDMSPTGGLARNPGMCSDQE